MCLFHLCALRPRARIWCEKKRNRFGTNVWLIILLLCLEILQAPLTQRPREEDQTRSTRAARGGAPRCGKRTSISSQSGQLDSAGPEGSVGRKMPREVALCPAEQFPSCSVPVALLKSCSSSQSPVTLLCSLEPSHLQNSASQGH